MQLVDYTNLYIKNLDLTVDSSDLFNHFSPYGCIVSARVMKNSQTKKSKGFGFVSFGTAEDAARALYFTNHTYIKSKPIVVAFHEPKKSRAVSPTPSTVVAAAAAPYLHASQSPALPPFASTAAQTLPPQTVAAMTTASAGRIPPPPPRQRFSAAPFFHPHHPKQHPQQQQQQQHRRSHSPESRTSSSATDAHTQRLCLVDAVLQCGETKATQDVVDMLLTLKPKDRSLCLFNRDYLREKIKEAKIALETCKDVDDEIDLLLESMQGLAVQEQKQRLGDRLFPCVKETGVRHAPRVTIRLLDTVPLDELAYAMKDTTVLKERINEVVMAMQEQQGLRFAF
ncbi:hypothetical protein BX666DRAFT_1893431 [Dichotomocladium elegans]|nr:hypothetical protein BX666DRAFT_1893431 [Dichotomocladium elegans]